MADLREAAKVEAAARLIDCACGDQPTGENRQRVAGQIVWESVCVDGFRLELTARCPLRCEVCSRVHPFMTAFELRDPNG